MGAGFIGDRWAGRKAASNIQLDMDELPVQDRAGVIMGAAEQIEAGRPVDLQDVVDTAVARAQEKQFKAPYELRVDEFEAKTESIAQRLDLTEEQRAALRQELRKELTPEDIRDTVTGFYKPEDRAPTMERAQEFIRKNGGVGTYVEADIANVGGLNARFGHTETDKIYREMSDIFKAAIEEAGGNGVLFRHGGDEISAIVVGVRSDVVSEALAGMKGHLDDLIERRNLADIPHAKDRRLPPGTRLYNATSDIVPGVPPEKIFKMADLKVEKQKKESLNVRQTRSAGARAPERRSRGFGEGDRRSDIGAGRRGRALRTGESFRRWTDNQAESYIAPAAEAGIEAAKVSAKLEAGPPKELADLISDTEKELNDIDRSLSAEDYARFDAEPEEGTMTAKQIQDMESTLPKYEEAVQKTANCQTGGR